MMPDVDSPDAPLRQFWDSWKEEVAANLEEILTNEKEKKGLPFKNISQASKFAAKELTILYSDKKEPFSPSTLTRNEIYRSVLESHVTQKHSRSVTSSERLKFQLEIRKLSKEIESLEKQLSKTLEDRSSAENRLSKSVTHNASVNAVEANFSEWKGVVEKLLCHIEGAEIDVQKRTIEDPNGVGTLLKEPDFPEGFFDWLGRYRK